MQIQFKNIRLITLVKHQGWSLTEKYLIFLATVFLNSKLSFSTGRLTLPGLSVFNDKLYFTVFSASLHLPSWGQVFDVFLQNVWRRRQPSCFWHLSSPSTRSRPHSYILNTRCVWCKVNSINTGQCTFISKSYTSFQIRLTPPLLFTFN